MKIENQVCTLEQAKKLKELGVEQESYFFMRTFPYNKDRDGEIYEFYKLPIPTPEDFYAAFTVAELGVMLPEMLPPQNGLEEYQAYLALRQLFPCEENEKYSTDYEAVTHDLDYDGTYYSFSAETEAQSRAKMLIYLLENNLTTLEEVNDAVKNK